MRTHAQSLYGSSEIAFLRTVLVWLSTYIHYQLNIFFQATQKRISDERYEIAYFVRIVCSQAFTQK